MEEDFKVNKFLKCSSYFYLKLTAEEKTEWMSSKCYNYFDEKVIAKIT